MKSARRQVSASRLLTRSTTLRTKPLDARTNGVLAWRRSCVLPAGRPRGWAIHERSPRPRWNLRRSRLLPYLAAGGSGERGVPSSHATGRAYTAGAAGCKRTMPRRSPRASCTRWSSGWPAGCIDSTTPAPSAAGCGGSSATRSSISPAGRAPASRPPNALSMHQPDPVSIDELAGELDEEFRARLRARRSDLRARPRPRVQSHTWEAFTRTRTSGARRSRGRSRAPA